MLQKNPLWLLESNYLKIKTKAGKIETLVLNNIQKKLHAIVSKALKSDKPARIIVLKARQEGVSTYIDSLLYCLTSSRKGINSLILADDVDGSNYLLDIVKLHHESVPEHLKPKEKKSNEKKLEFEALHSQILVDTANNENAGRKYTYQYAHLSEQAYYAPSKCKDMMGGLLQAVPDLPNTLLIVESTANGVGGYFHDLWHLAGKDDNDWIPVFFGWQENIEYTSNAPEYFILTKEEEEYKNDVKTASGYVFSNNQMYWRRLKIQNSFTGDVDRFNQEYPAYPAQAFLLSGRARFDVNILIKLMTKIRKPLIVREGFAIYEQPKPLRPYIIGVDTAEGLIHGDNTIATVLDPITFEVVAKYRGKLEPEKLGERLVDWGKQYNDALVAVEVNNHGLTALTVLKRLGYDNIYYRKVYDKIADKWTEKIGWQTSVRTKPFLIDHLATALTNGLYVPSKDTIDELMTYVINDDGTTSAQEGLHDDEVMALAVANQAYIEANLKEKVIVPKVDKGSVAYEILKQEQESSDWRSRF